MKKAQREVRLPIVIDLSVTALDEAAVVIWDVPRVRAFPLSGVIGLRAMNFWVALVCFGLTWACRVRQRAWDPL